MTSSFDRRPIFVTGAASGIGKSIVMRLLAAGFVVGLSDRNLDLCRALRDQIDPEGLATDVHGVDVRDRGAIMDALDHLETQIWSTLWSGCGGRSFASRPRRGHG